MTRIRDAIRGIKAQWRDSGPGGRLLIALGLVLGAALIAAFLFGAWHVLFGGFVKGNWRAGGFGIALAAGTGVALVMEATVWRRVVARGH